MPTSGDRNDPFLAFRYKVTVDNMPPAGFSEVSGLQLEVEFQDYAEGGLNTHMRKFAGRTKQTNLTLKRGIVDRALWDWHYGLTQGSASYRNVTIIVYDPSGSTEVMEWRVIRALPAKWIGPALNATQNSVAVETLELVHQGLERLT